MDKIYCQHGTELMRELKRSKKWLPPYNEETLRQVSIECHSCFESMKESYVAAQKAAQQTGQQGTHTHTKHTHTHTRKEKHTQEINRVTSTREQKEQR